MVQRRRSLRTHVVWKPGGWRNLHWLQLGWGFTRWALNFRDTAAFINSQLHLSSYFRGGSFPKEIVCSLPMTVHYFTLNLSPSKTQGCLLDLRTPSYVWGYKKHAPEPKVALTIPWTSVGWVRVQPKVWVPTYFHADIHSHGNTSQGRVLLLSSWLHSNFSNYIQQKWISPEISITEGIFHCHHLTAVQRLSGVILLNYFLISSHSSCFFIVGPLFAHQSVNPVSIYIKGIL